MGKSIKLPTEQDQLETAAKLLHENKVAREQAAQSEFNDFVKAWSEKYKVALNISQPQLTITAL